MALTRHTLEVAAAVAVIAAAGLTLYGSAGLDTGWGAGGPQSGYFPFRLGLILLVVGGLLLAQAWRERPTRSQEVFATVEQLRRSAALFVPTTLLVLAMPWLGVYVSGAVFLTAMAHRHGHFGWPRSLALGVGAMGLFFGVFELWFNVPLAKGPLETWLGY